MTYSSTIHQDSTGRTSSTLAKSHQRRSVVRAETALDWYHRSAKRRRLASSSLLPSSSSSSHPSWLFELISLDDDEEFPLDPVSAAQLFLWAAKSGIAPVDAAWRRCVADAAAGRNRLYHGGDDDDYGLPWWGSSHSAPPPPPPPVVILEGPHKVGKTMMLMSLAARFVVATRASLFDGRGVTHHRDSKGGGDENDGGVDKRADSAPRSDTDSVKPRTTTPSEQPIVLFLDSSYDFTIAQLTYVVRSTLLRQPIHRLGSSNDGEGKKQQRDELLDEKGKEHLIELDLEDCLGRIHVAQVDDGSTGWVPLLEALRHQLGHRRQQEQARRQQDFEAQTAEELSPWPSSTPTPLPIPEGGGHVPSIAANKDKDRQKGTTPTLLLWDGFLSDVPSGDETSAREILQQVSRMLDQESDSLWWVATTTATGSSITSAPAAAEHSAHHHMEASNASPAFTGGVGYRVTEWIQKHHQQQVKQPVQQARYHQSTGPSLPPFPTTRTLPTRTTCRVRLERPIGPAVSKSSAYAVVQRGGSNRSAGTSNGSVKIPYSLSLQGILS